MDKNLKEILVYVLLTIEPKYSFGLFTFPLTLFTYTGTFAKVATYLGLLQKLLHPFGSSRTSRAVWVQETACRTLKRKEIYAGT